jgi:hypothetical protein
MALPSALQAALYPPGAGSEGAFGTLSLQPTAEAPQEKLVVEGRVTRTKWYSTKLFFFDVDLQHAPTTCNDNLSPALPRVDGHGPALFVLCKGSLHERGVLTAADVIEIAEGIKLGDDVRVTFCPRLLDARKGERTACAHTVHVSRTWASWHPGGEAFEECTQAPAIREGVQTSTFRARAPRGELCKFWVNTGRCPLRSCALKHVDGEERRAARQSFIQARAEQRLRAMAVQSAAVGDATAPQGKQKKKHRARIFAQWLVDTFGAEALARGAGVLDIAGGKGEVTQHLAALGVPSTVPPPPPSY